MVFPRPAHLRPPAPGPAHGRQLPLHRRPRRRLRGALGRVPRPWLHRSTPCAPRTRSRWWSRGRSRRRRTPTCTPAGSTRSASDRAPRVSGPSRHHNPRREVEGGHRAVLDVGRHQTILDSCDQLVRPPYRGLGDALVDQQLPVVSSTSPGCRGSRRRSRSPRRAGGLAGGGAASTRRPEARPAGPRVRSSTSPPVRPSSMRAFRAFRRRIAAWEMRWLISS